MTSEKLDEAVVRTVVGVVVVCHEAGPCQIVLLARVEEMILTPEQGQSLAASSIPQ